MSAVCSLSVFLRHDPGNDARTTVLSWGDERGKDQLVFWEGEGPDRMHNPEDLGLTRPWSASNERRFLLQF